MAGNPFTIAGCIDAEFANTLDLPCHADVLLEFANGGSQNHGA